jgi:hypothetical protein
MGASKASKGAVPTVLWLAEAGGTRGYNGASLLPKVYLMEGGAEYYDERSSSVPSERVSSQTGKEFAVSVAQARAEVGEDVSFRSDLIPTPSFNFVNGTGPSLHVKPCPAVV